VDKQKFAQHCADCGSDKEPENLIKLYTENKYDGVSCCVDCLHETMFSPHVCTNCDAHFEKEREIHSTTLEDGFGILACKDCFDTFQRKNDERNR
jgi:hypothetical protein